MTRAEATRHVLNIIEMPVGDTYTVPNKTTRDSFYNSMMQRLNRADENMKVKCFTLNGDLVVMKVE